MRTWEIVAFVLLFAGTFAVALAAWASIPAPTASRVLTHQSTGDASGLTVADVAMNASDGWTVSEGRRVLVTADAFEVREAAQSVQIPDHVDTGGVTGVLAIGDEERTGQLVVAYGDEIELELPGPGNATGASIATDLAGPQTSVTVASQRCQIAVTDTHGPASPDGEAIVLSQPGAGLDARLSGAGDACPDVHASVELLGRGWSWR